MGMNPDDVKLWRFVATDAISCASTPFAEFKQVRLRGAIVPLEAGQWDRL